MFSQYGQRRPFNPATPVQPGGTTGGSTGNSNSSYQIRPDFAGQPQQQSNSGQGSPGPMRRIQQDAYQQMSPQSQRSALFDTARQNVQYERQIQMSNPMGIQNSALPGGLTERQRMDFDALRRTNPQAAQQQLLKYQRNADIRYNKPTTGPATPPPGPTHRQPPTNFNGPNRTFGR
ncbi:hypothetical protein JNM87_02610 [Candidatus Saccharibacteria bacterium]|nr:hypothetical protein [Candidatus Saccharibacteria bacterium]